MKEKTFFQTVALIIITSSISNAQQSFRNEISTAPLSPFFHHLQLIYERQIDSTITVGLQGRYYYATPPSDYDSVESNGGDATFFLKINAKKKPGGFYLLLGGIIGSYHIAAGYGYIGQGWFGDVPIITTVEPKAFLTFGGKMMLGYKILIHRFSMDFSAGGKFLVLPSEVTNPVNNNELLNAWGEYSWTDIPSPGCPFSLGITAGYRF